MIPLIGRPDSRSGARWMPGKPGLSHTRYLMETSELVWSVLLGIQVLRLVVGFPLGLQREYPDPDFAPRMELLVRGEGVLQENLTAAPPTIDSPRYPVTD